MLKYLQNLFFIIIFIKMKKPFGFQISYCLLVFSSFDNKN